MHKFVEIFSAELVRKTLALKTEMPLICSAEMVRQILAGNKTKSRRVINPQPFQDVIGLRKFDYKTVDYLFYVQETNRDIQLSDAQSLKKGDLREVVIGKYDNAVKLWIREAVYIAPPNFCEPSGCNCYDAEDRPRLVGYKATMSKTAMLCAEDYGSVKCSPSIHMPRWACRINLDTVSVHPERLQQITLEDARAEGFQDIEAFKVYWNMLNLERGFAWYTNPWVWVLEWKPFEGIVNGNEYIRNRVRMKEKEFTV